MSPWLDIILPVRNSGAELGATITSLSTQTARGFRVLLSDNFSKLGLEDLAKAEQQLTAAGIPLQRLCPPFELSPVEHLNWAHSQGTSDWLKPLLAGDQLGTRYVAALGDRLAARPAAQMIWCGFEIPGTNPERLTASAPICEPNVTAVEFLKFYPGCNDWFGGPANLAYSRIAWRAWGGFENLTPATAFEYLFAGMALHFGLDLISEPLVRHFVPVVPASSEQGDFRVNRRLETWLVLRSLRNLCLTSRLPWPKSGIWRGLRAQSGFRSRLSARTV